MDRSSLNRSYHLSSRSYISWLWNVKSQQSSTLNAGLGSNLTNEVFRKTGNQTVLSLNLDEIFVAWLPISAQVVIFMSFCVYYFSTLSCPFVRCCLKRFGTGVPSSVSNIDLVRFVLVVWGNNNGQKDKATHSGKEVDTEWIIIFKDKRSKSLLKEQLYVSRFRGVFSTNISQEIRQPSWRCQLQWWKRVFQRDLAVGASL